jgi:hypothetical protein
MAMEIHVLFRGKLPSKAALQKTMRELGFPFSIKPATGSLEQQNGFMPMLLEREETGVEFDVFERWRRLRARMSTHVSIASPISAGAGACTNAPRPCAGPLRWPRS